MLLLLAYGLSVNGEFNSVPLGIVSPVGSKPIMKYSFVDPAVKPVYPPYSDFK